MISKAGVCSRTAAESMVRAGRVELDNQLLLDPEFPIEEHQRERIRIDGAPLALATRGYVVLNKPRGLLVTAQDEHARDTVYRCLDDASLPWLAPVGRLDRASEGLLLLSNDSEWAARITDPAS
ncbi:MAG: pseudouridine synthase, partial [Lysobacterales bacterium]